MTTSAEKETPQQEAAALLVLQENHAVCEIDTEGFLRVDLNPCTAIRDHATAHTIARSILGLREELKILLMSQRTVH